ncbi:MAG: helix-turn-helix domain-containing protein [Proteobacteria bacterium]|nr:helix-turn-helix domain-containing protein [Pseudomonadota bacterium]
MAIKIRPRGNFDATRERLAALGVTFTGYNHRERCYVDVAIPPGVEAALGADPLIEVEAGPPPGSRQADRAWSSPASGVAPKDVGDRLRALRAGAGLDLQAAAALTGGALSPDAISRIEATGDCTVRELIVLADLYGASLDRIAGRSVARGDRRR